MTRGEVLRYLGWQVRDRTGPRILVGWLIVAALCLPLHFAVKDDPPPSPETLAGMVHGMYVQLAGLAVVILFHGIVAEDRTKGYYRFYLAKPVSPLWFYGQSYVLAVAGMLVFTAGFLAIFSVAVIPAWHWRLLTTGAALGLLIGGMIFALSTVTARDWIFMILAIITSTALRARFPSDRSTLGKVLNAVLPPNQLTDEATLTAGEWAWVAGWGIGLFAIGLLVLRRRPLGED